MPCRHVLAVDLGDLWKHIKSDLCKRELIWPKHRAGANTVIHVSAFEAG